MRLVVTCGVAYSALLAASPLAAQQHTTARNASSSDSAASASVRRPGRIVGVFDEESGNPIPGAEVTDLFTGGVAHTESHGVVELSQFAERNDSAAVRIRKLGYADTALVVMVGANDTMPVQVNLEKAAVNLPALIANATSTPTLEERELAGFEGRRKLGFGRFIDGSELRSHVDNHPFDDYLASHIPAMSLIIDPRTGAEYLSSGRGQCSGPAFQCGGGNKSCPIALYIDGAAVWVPGIGVPWPDLRDYKSEDFIAVEWYPGAATVPLKYGGTGAQCGVMLLWRKY